MSEAAAVASNVPVLVVRDAAGDFDFDFDFDARALSAQDIIPYMNRRHDAVSHAACE